MNNGNKIKRGYRKGRGIRLVTNEPGFWLRLKGRIDSHKGESVAVNQLRLYEHRCTKIEAGECLMAETVLEPARKEASIALETISRGRGAYESDTSMDALSQGNAISMA